MALALLARNASKIEGLQKVVRIYPGVVGNCTLYSQFAQKSVQNVQRNDKAPVLFRGISVSAPLRSAAHGDHRMLWNVERLLSVALIGIVPVAIASPSMLTDNLLAISIVAHQHWGLEACVIDYIRPVLVGVAVHKMALGALYVVSFLTLGGLFYFNYKDVGIGKAVKKLWSLKAK